MQVIPHLSFNGQCEAAFRAYEVCFGGGTIAFLLTYGSHGVVTPSVELEGKVFHATLKVGDQKITGVDVAQAAYEKPQGFAVQLNIEQVAEAERLYAALSANGTIAVPMQRTSWSGHYAAFTDRFGTPWEINCEA